MEVDIRYSLRGVFYSSIKNTEANIIIDKIKESLKEKDDCLKNMSLNL